MSEIRVLLTGAAGKVGRYVVPQLLELGYRVYATDVVAKPGRFTQLEGLNYRECDLTQQASVNALMVEVMPQVILHTAAIVAPISYTCSTLAKKVNVDATAYLLEAARQLSLGAHFVFCSSYTVHGPCAPEQQSWDCDTAYNPSDDYGHQKVAAEQLVKQHTGGWSILRIGGVFDADVLMPKHENFKAFAFMVPLGQHEHGVDVQDVATALVNSARVRPENKVLMIGGDPSWQKTAEQIRGDIFSAMGLRLDRIKDAYRQPGPTSDNQGWYFENWMDTREAQQLLKFQNHSYQNFTDRVRKKSRIIRLVGRLLGGLITKKLKQGSPYVGEKSVLCQATLWEDIKSVYGAEDAALLVSD